MQNLIRRIQEARRKGLFTDQQMVNQVREYIQVLLLKAIYQSKYGRGLSFGGGTCLRICYTLKRYSEDLDFCLDEAVSGYAFADLNETTARFLKQRGFDCHLHVRSDKVVQKSFIRVSDLLPRIGAQFRHSQKLHIKLEVDTRPIPVMPAERETFFVTKFDENFPILKHTNETLFAGKILAVLHRTYTKGRDYYDLLWHLGQKSGINLGYLNKGMLQQGGKKQFLNEEDVLQVLEKKAAEVSVGAILKDISPFLEDSEEEKWMQDYPKFFRQLLGQYRAVRGS